MSPASARWVYAAALALALSLLVATGFHSMHLICDTKLSGGGKGTLLLAGMGDLLRDPLHFLALVGPLWVGWTLLLMAAANRAISPVLGMGVVVASILGTVIFYAFIAPRLACDSYGDGAMTLRIAAFLGFLAVLLAIPRLWRRK
ncbi:hypothetical protein [Thioclava indica]|uniref:Uncharacterized protein n=1 Tax=Thioclava indica TaxID=1353528 RepID=A0A074JUL0_9RHOB|nr:hypothetical protein [Thioclava indica]KEO59313.1 hypothetical protein DT23_04340 [Thioclava indica]